MGLLHDNGQKVPGVVATGIKGSGQFSRRCDGRRCVDAGRRKMAPSWLPAPKTTALPAI
jgi:hypothetical protein